jgi:hypothetical protein
MHCWHNVAPVYSVQSKQNGMGVPSETKERGEYRRIYRVFMYELCQNGIKWEPVSNVSFILLADIKR